MPWKKVEPMEELIKLIGDWLDGGGVSELARKYNVSRKTIYKWCRRFEERGHEGFLEQSRRPHNSPNQTSREVVELLVEFKKKHLCWGPRKLVKRLGEKYPDIVFPAASTAGEWLKKHGLVRKRKLRKKVPDYKLPLHEAHDPNDVWSVDYKGEFRTGDGIYCYPLTVSDNASRYLLGCEGHYGARYIDARAEFERIFKRHGLPAVIRSDNGVPFAGRSFCGLSRLSLWWLKLGIIPERTGKGKPQENGRHERMHRTLKEETANPAAENMLRQNLRFVEFQKVYNEERPHEGIGFRRPVELYEKSSREYFDAVKPFDYDFCFTVRNVRHNGEIKYRGGLYYLGSLLSGERVGIFEEDAENPVIYLGDYPLCRLEMSLGQLCELSREERLDLLPMSPV